MEKAKPKARSFTRISTAYRSSTPNLLENIRKKEGEL
jgi:hypothetical protein